MRLFSVLRYESVIHEFDPYFNFRTTKFLSAAGPYALLNWFDDRAWYAAPAAVLRTCTLSLLDGTCPAVKGGSHPLTPA